MSLGVGLWSNGCHPTFFYILGVGCHGNPIEATAPLTASFFSFLIKRIERKQREAALKFYDSTALLIAERMEDGTVVALAALIVVVVILIYLKHRKP
jgi:hypothetical protein